MDSKRLEYTNIDEYIQQFSPELQEVLQQLRAAIKAAAPEAEERISYQMPAYYYKGNLVYFAVCKKHMGFYPTPSGIEAFKDELSGYKQSKGAVQFPIGQPLPLELISRMVRFRVQENHKRTKK